VTTDLLCFDYITNKYKYKTDTNTESFLTYLYKVDMNDRLFYYKLSKKYPNYYFDKRFIKEHLVKTKLEGNYYNKNTN